MQVSHAIDSETVAVVGGRRKRNFTVKSSAHAFRIMSAALYSQKELAVVRETICNAIDAHVRAGKSDVPIEISLTQTEFSVKDFGAGIHDDKIDEVFCSMFGSDKTDDDTQIGGFGAGAKAPFSVSDHFTVVSCHDGKRTIYSMHKEGEEDGLPVCQEMASGPCDSETGLTVTVPIREKTFELYRNLIVNFVLEGGFKAKLNGVELPTRNYTQLRKNGFGVVHVNNYTSNTKVLLGNVTYTIDRSGCPKEVYDKILELRNIINFPCEIILHAQPGDVAPTPSREDLSFTETTIASLVRIINMAIKKLRPLVPKYRNKISADIIRETGRCDLVKIGVNITNVARDKYHAALVTNSHVAEPDKIAEIITYYSLTQKIDVKLKLKIAGNIFRDHTHGVRVISAINNEYYLSLERLFFKEERKLRFKQFLRIIKEYTSDPISYSRCNVQIEEFGNLYKFPSLSAAKSKFSSSHINIPDMIIRIARSKKDYEIDTTVSFNSVFVIIDKFISDESVAALKERAKKFGFEVQFIEHKEEEKPKPRVKKIKKAPETYKFTAMKMSRHTKCLSYGNFACWLSSDRSVENPAAYIDAEIFRSTTGSNGVKSNQFIDGEKLSKSVSELFGEVAVVINAKDRNILEARETPFLLDLVMEKLKEMVKAHPKHVAVSMSALRCLKRFHNKDVSRKAFCLLTGLKYNVDSAADKVWNFVFLIDDILELRIKAIRTAKIDTEQKYKQQIYDQYEKAERKVRKENNSIDLFMKRLEKGDDEIWELYKLQNAVNAILSLRFSEIDEDFDDVIAVVEYMRAKARKRTNSKQVETGKEGNI
jgi:hypothetical protein